MPPEYMPTVDQVAAVIRARTRDKNGNLVGTFTAGTNPTDTQVAELAASAADDVSDAIGPDANVPGDLVEQATKVAAIGAAKMIELSYYPEQVGANRSPYAQLDKDYTDRLNRLRAAVSAEGGETPGDEYMHPVGAFGGNPMPIRWWTQWLIDPRPRRLGNRSHARGRGDVEW